MPEALDVSGETFGQLTVLGQAARDKHGRICWRCLCECGNEIVRPTGALTSGNTKSCGCGRHNPRNVRDLTGQTFNNLTVLERAGRTSYGQARWRCRCVCGNEVMVASASIAHGGTKSCGCLETGIGPATSAVIYLVAHKPWNAVKIGIAKQGSSRLTQHRRQGWITAWIIDGLTGADAYAVEKIVLESWRSAGIYEGVPPELMPKGYTETAPAHLVDREQTRTLVIKSLSNVKYDMLSRLTFQTKEDA